MRFQLLLLVGGLATVSAASRRGAGLPGAPAPDSVVYRIVPASHFDVVTGKGGLFGFAGHRHRIRAGEVNGEAVYYADSLGLSHVEVSVPVTSLEVLTPRDTAEVRKVRHTMLTDVLHPEQHPRVSFSGQLTSLHRDEASVLATLTLEGVSRTIPVMATVHITPYSLLATCRFTVKQSDFGITPFSGGPMGTVKVADEVTFEIEAMGVRE